MKHLQVAPELSRPLQVDRISLGGVREHIVAGPDERKALAKRFNLLDLSRLEATLDVDHAEGGILAVKGKLFADVVQECVVTLEPVPAHVSDSIDVLFAPTNLLKAKDEGELYDCGDAEPPEPVENGVIDLGELVSQHLATALDPYPRKEGAVIGSYEVGGETPKESPKVENPFAKLKDLSKFKN